MQVATHCCRELLSWVTIGGVEWLKHPSCRRAEGEHAMADKTGSCLCGAVAFEITGPLRSVIACHCRHGRIGGESLVARRIRSACRAVPVLWKMRARCVLTVVIETSSAVATSAGVS